MNDTPSMGINASNKHHIEKYAKALPLRLSKTVNTQDEYYISAVRRRGGMVKTQLKDFKG